MNAIRHWRGPMTLHRTPHQSPGGLCFYANAERPCISPARRMKGFLPLEEHEQERDEEGKRTFRLAQRPNPLYDK